MSRVHIGLVVKDLKKARHYYSTLFGAEPSVERDDYIKWTPAHIPMNFTIIDRQENAAFGVVHFGIETEDEEELQATIKRLEQATDEVRREDDAECCYHRSKKAWAVDPDAFLWEVFHTSEQHLEYGDDKWDLKEIRDRAQARLQDSASA
ncbi:MAG: VOC family protein [Pseudomonadota bacterium]